MDDLSDLLNNFNLNGSNGQGMPLLGAIAGLGAAAAPSRLPVPTGVAFGNLAGGIMAGRQAQVQQQLMEQKALEGAVNTQMNLADIGLITGDNPSAQDILSGRWHPNLGHMLGGILGTGGSPSQQAQPQIQTPTATSPSLP